MKPKLGFFSFMSRPQNSFEPYRDPKNSQIGPQKVKDNPKIQSKLNVRIEGIKKIKVIALYEQPPKQIEPDPNPRNSLFFGPKKPKKNNLKLDKLKSKN